jgi:lipopolysaccharide transport system permease protein
VLKIITSLSGFNRQDLKLILNYFKLNIQDRYLGSSLGSIWAVLNPVLMLGLYTFVFGYIFKAKAPGSETTLGYAIWLISGYGSWMATTEGISTATGSVVAGAGLIKNIAFKTEVLPVASALTGLVSLVVSVGFLLILLVVDNNPPTWHSVFILPVIAIQFLLIISIGFFFAAINVFIRDFYIVLPNLLTILLFITPIFYPLESIPPILKAFSKVNPFYILSEAYRETLIYHHKPDLVGLLYVAILSVGIGLAGLKFFRRLKGHFEAML